MAQEEPKVQYDTEDEPIILSKPLLDLLLRQEDSKPSDLIGLYSFYYYTAKWQKTNQPKATVSFVSKGLRWEEKKVKRNKRVLVGLGLIKDVVRRDAESRKITGHYIKVNFIWSRDSVDRILQKSSEKPGGWFPTRLVDHLPGNRGENALSSNRNALSSNRTLGANAPDGAFCGQDKAANPPRTHQPPSPARIAGAQILHRFRLIDMLESVTQTDIPVPTKGSQEYWKLVTKLGSLLTKQGISLERIRAVIRWYWDHSNDQYSPAVTNHHQFCDKFLSIEAAMKRSLKEEDINSSTIHSKTGHYSCYRKHYDDNVKTLGLDREDISI